MPHITKVEISGDLLSPRTTPVAAAIENTIYVFGGGHENWRGHEVTMFDETYAFDTTTNTMRHLSPAGDIPQPRFFAAATADDQQGHLYVFGGSSYDHGFKDVSTFGDLYRYSPDNNEWALLTTTEQGPGPRGCCNMWTHDGGVYVFGGINDQMVNYNDLWRYDLREERWIELTGTHDTVQPRFEAASGTTSDDGKVYVFGGERMGDNFQPVVLTDTIEIDLSTGEMHTVSEQRDPAGGTHHQCFAGSVDGALYTYGGDDPSDKVMGCEAPYPQGVIGQLWKFDPSDSTWELAADEGPKIKRGATAVANGRLYLFGGYGFECADESDRGQIQNEDVICIDPAS